MLRKPLILCASIALVAIPFAVAACGSSDDSSDSTTVSATESTTSAATGGGAESVLAFSETEFKIDPADPTAKAGKVTLAVKNDGSVTHNLEIEGNGVEEVTSDLSPGDSDDLTVDLQPGSYEIYCTIDSHRDMGMEGEVTVQ